MSTKNVALPIEYSRIDSGTLSAFGYTAISATGLSKPCDMIRIVNRSKHDVEISFDGYTDHDYLKSDDEMQISVQPSENRAAFPKGQKIYLLSPASIGYIYLIGYYQPNYS